MRVNGKQSDSVRKKIMTRHAYCHFCDDIRYEVGNKVSAIGIYSGLLYLSDIPTVLPKLCILAFCSTDIDKPFRKLSVKLSVGDIVIHDQEIPQDALAAIGEDMKRDLDERDPISVISLGTQIVLSPFNVPEEGTLVVTMIADGESMVAGKLRIRRAKQDVATQ